MLTDFAFTGGLELAQTCADAAWRRMRRMLFEPFNLQRWFILGFAAWLANLGEGASGFNFNVPGPRSGGGKVEALLQSVVQYCRDHLFLVIAVALLAVVLLLALGILVAWVSSRGKFVFLDCTARDHLLVTEPWAAYRKEGDSLFWWRLGYGAVLVMLFLGLGGSAAALFFLTSWTLLPKIILIAGIILLLLLLLSAMWLVGRLLDDLVVPFMYKDRLTAAVAWRRAGRLLRDAWPAVAAYLLLYIALNLLAAVAVIFLILATCCIAGCLMLFPYIGTVLLLPVSVFFRLYSLYFFQGIVPDARLVAEG